MVNIYWKSISLQCNWFCIYVDSHVMPNMNITHTLAQLIVVPNRIHHRFCVIQMILRFLFFFSLNSFSIGNRNLLPRHMYLLYAYDKWTFNSCALIVMQTFSFFIQYWRWMRSFCCCSSISFRFWLVFWLVSWCMTIEYTV